MNTRTNTPNSANAQSCCSASSGCPSQPSRRGNGRKFKSAALGLCNDDATTIRNKGM